MGEDEHLGAASPTLLVSSRLVGGGKDGHYFLLDGAKMNTAGTKVTLIQ